MKIHYPLLDDYWNIITKMQGELLDCRLVDIARY